MSELIHSAKSHLKQIIPRALNIDVKLQRDHEFFVGKVHVNLPGGILHATKRAATPWEAIDQSCDAVLKQMKKLRSRRVRRRPRELTSQSA